MSSQERMAICAIRYTIGRSSYIVSDGQQWSRERGAMSKKAFDKIAEGLTEAIAIARNERTPARMHVPAEIDVRAVLADLDAMALEGGP